MLFVGNPVKQALAEACFCFVKVLVEIRGIEPRTYEWESRNFAC